MQMKYCCVYNATTSSQAHDGKSPFKITNSIKKWKGMPPKLWWYLKKNTTQIKSLSNIWNIKSTHFEIIVVNVKTSNQMGDDSNLDN